MTFIKWECGRVLGFFWGAITESAQSIRRNVGNQESGSKGTVRGVAKRKTI